MQITVVERAKMESKNGERANMYANWTLNGHLPRAPSPLIILLPRCRETRKRDPGRTIGEGEFLTAWPFDVDALTLTS